MKKNDIFKKTPEEMKRTLTDLEKEIKDSRIKLATNKEKNVHLTKLKRKDIAIIKTILREKELEEKNG